MTTSKALTRSLATRRRRSAVAAVFTGDRVHVPDLPPEQQRQRESHPHLAGLPSSAHRRSARMIGSPRGCPGTRPPAAERGRPASPGAPSLRSSAAVTPGANRPRPRCGRRGPPSSPSVMRRAASSAWRRIRSCASWRSAAPGGRVHHHRLHDHEREVHGEVGGDDHPVIHPQPGGRRSRPGSACASVAM